MNRVSKDEAMETAAETVEKLRSEGNDTLADVLEVLLEEQAKIIDEKEMINPFAFTVGTNEEDEHGVISVIAAPPPFIYECIKHLISSLPKVFKERLIMEVVAREIFKMEKEDEEKKEHSPALSMN